MAPNNDNLKKVEERLHWGADYRPLPGRPDPADYDDSYREYLKQYRDVLDPLGRRYLDYDSWNKFGRPRR